MNDTIIVSRLITLLAERTGCSEATAGLFVNALVEAVGDGLSHGGQVKIKGIGTFYVSDLDRDVKFNPEKSLADAINAPFALFEGVELDDDFEMDIPSDGADEEPVEEEIAEADESAEAEESTEAEEIAEVVLPEVTAERCDEHEVPPTPSEEVVVPEAVVETVEEPVTEESVSEPDYPSNHEEMGVAESPKRDSQRIPTGNVEGTPAPEVVERVIYVKSNRLPAIFLAIILGLVGGFFLGMIYQQSRNAAITTTKAELIEEIPQDKTSRDTIAEPQDTASAGQRPMQANDADQSLQGAADGRDSQLRETPQNQPSATEAKPATGATVGATLPTVDVVTKNQFLTTLARKYYNNHYEYWVYIYEENKANISHPDMVTPGTQVTVPSLQKYGVVNPDDAASIWRARQRAGEIYARLAAGQK